MFKINNSTTKYLKQWTTPYNKVLIFLCVLSAISSVGFVAMALFSKNIVNIATGKQNGHINFQFIGCGVTIAIITLCKVLSGLITNKSSARLTNAISISLWEKLCKKTYKDISSRHSGELTHLFSSDIELISSNYISILPSAISSFIKIVLGTIVIAIIDIYFALFCVAIGIVIALMVTICRPYYKKAQARCQQSRAKANSVVQESISNIEAIKPLELYEQVGQTFDKSLQENYNAKIDRGKVAILVNCIIFATFNVAFYVALAIGTYRITKNNLLIGDLFALVQLLQLIKSPFSEAMGIIPQAITLSASTQRIMAVDSMTDDTTIEWEHDDFDKMIINDLSFGYNDNLIFENLSFDLNKGQKVGIIGYSGCGKSSLAKILVNLLSPTSGSVNLTYKGSNSNGLPTKLISYVPQSNILFSGTVLENIMLGNSPADINLVENVCDIACASEFIKTLPNGINTVIGEKGYGLSQGQCARIAIARALLLDAPIIILDEITASLDKTTSATLIANLCKIENKTMVIITHSNVLAKNCDLIINLEEFHC